MSWRIHYRDCGARFSVAVECSQVQAGRIAKLLPEGHLAGADQRATPEEIRALRLACLVTRIELDRIAEKSK